MQACLLASASFFPGLFFDHKEGGDTFLQNIRLSPNRSIQALLNFFKKDYQRTVHDIKCRLRLRTATFI
jgi:hypothetical protein